MFAENYMYESININGQDIEYELRRSGRARNLRITHYPDKGLVVTLPYLATKKMAQRFLISKSAWILKRLAEEVDLTNKIIIRTERNDYKKYKEAARLFAIQKLEMYNKFYNFEYNRISIRNQKTRWGSCSVDKNLNFNYLIIKLPEKMADYIIVHELCHLKEMNHSQKFWDLVALTIPDCKVLRKEFKRIKII